MTTFGRATTRFLAEATAATVPQAQKSFRACRPRAFQLWATSGSFLLGEHGLVASKRFSATATLLREFKKLTAEDKAPVVKTAEQLVEELFKGMEKFDISQADLQAALVAKLAPAAQPVDTQREAA